MKPSTPAGRQKGSRMPDKADERVAEALRVAMFDFLVAVKQGAVSLARSALEQALQMQRIYQTRSIVPRSPRRVSTRRIRLDPWHSRPDTPPMTLGNMRDLGVREGERL
jgi:hypothetical protein